MYLKRLAKLQEWVLRIRAKRNVHINLRPEISGFYFNWKIRKNYFNCLIFYFSWHNTLTAHDLNFIYVEFLLFVKFTKSTQNFLHLNQCTRGHSWSRNVTRFQRSRGCCEWFDRHQQCIGEVPLPFQCLSSQTNEGTSCWTVQWKRSVSKDVAAAGNLPKPQLLAVASITFVKRHKVCCFSR